MEEFTTVGSMLREPRRAGGSGVESFIKEYAPVFQAIGERIDVSPRVLAAQFGLETGWGSGVIPGTNNLGNIKDFSGGGVAATDNITGSRDKYRAYGSPEQFADDYVRLITSRYPGAVGAGNDPVRFARALKAGGYAEDPGYVQKIAGAYSRISPDAIPEGGDSEFSTVGRMGGAGGREAQKASPAVSAGKYVPYDEFLRQRMSGPDGKGMREVDIAREWMRDYGSMEAPADNGGDFGRGFKVAFQQLPQTAYGLAAIMSSAVESAVGPGGMATSAKNWSVGKYGEWGKKIAENAAETDEFDVSWKRAKEGDFGALVDWLQYGVGYGAGQLVQAAGMLGAGSLAGRVALKPAVERLAGGMVEKEVAALTAKGIAQAEVQKQAVANVAAKVGGMAAVGAQAFGMEGGEIGGDLAEKSQKEGRTLTGAELARGLGATIAAGSMEFAGDMLALGAAGGRLTRGMRGMGGVGGRAARAAVGGVGTAAGEGVTEYFQTLAEEYGKGNDPLSPESLRQAGNAAALGAVGGGAIGSAGGALQGPQALPVTPGPVVGKPAPVPAPRNDAEAVAPIMAAGTADEAMDAAVRGALAPLGPSSTLDAPIAQAVASGLDSGIGAFKSELDAAIERQKQADYDALQRESKLPAAMYDADLAALAARREEDAGTQANAGMGLTPVQRAAVEAAGSGNPAGTPAGNPAGTPASEPTAMQLAMERARAARAAVPAGGTDVTNVTNAGNAQNTQDWVSFSKESGTLGIPRAEMPQVKAEHRGPLVNFLNARGVTHQEETLQAGSLKATQAEFSPSKVAQAQAYEGGDRAVLVSADGHIVDGHHQALARAAQGQEIRAIRLNAPIRQLLPMVREFPSAEVSKSGAVKGAEVSRETSPTSVNTESQPVNTESSAITPEMQAAADAPIGTLFGKPANEIPLKRVRGAAKSQGPVGDRARAELARREAKRAIDAEARAATERLKDTPSRDLLRIIQAMGGINSKHAVTVAGDKGVKGLGPWARLFKNQKRDLAGRISEGHGMDEVALELQRQGYMTQAEYESDGSNIAERMVRDAIAGQLEPITPDQVRKAFEANRKAKADEEADPKRQAEAANAKWDEATVDLLNDEHEGMSEAERADLDALIDDALAEIGQFRMAEIQERLAIQTGSEVEYAKALTKAILEEYGQSVRLRTGQEAVAAPSASIGGRVGEETGGAAPQGEPLTLTAPTTQDLAAKAQQESAQALKAAAEAMKATADAMREQFTLTGSTRPADELAARGQEDLFGSASTEAPSTKPPALFSKKSNTFYSQLARTVENAKQNIAPGPQWKAWIKNQPGVKQDEIEATGVNEWLDLQQGKVTKEQLSAFLEQNGVRVEEVEIGKSRDFTAVKFRDVADKNSVPGNSYASDDDWVVMMDGRPVYVTFGDSAQHAIQLYHNDADVEANGDGFTKFSEYQLPGGTNYRELLLTLPVKSDKSNWSVVAHPSGSGYAIRADNGQYGLNPNGAGERRWSSVDAARNGIADYAETQEQPGFHSQHFSQPNILAHIRFNERTDADGKRVLFIEEIQSDWAQAGKRRGFRDTDAWTSFERQGYTVAKDGDYWMVYDYNGDPVSEGATQQEAIADLVGRDTQNITPDGATNESGVPRGPYVQKTEAWVALSLKRMIRYAAENGFDRVAWTNGEQQADRYSLRHQVDSIEVAPGKAKGTKSVTIKTPRAVVRLDVNDKAMVTDSTLRASFGDAVGKPLADVVGKGMAEKIMAADSATFEGEGLNIGGEGMKAFYDKIVPNVANDVLKKLGGGRVGEIAFTPTAEEQTGWESVGTHTGPDLAAAQPGFDVTPAMREKAMAGLPLFARRQQAQERAPSVSARDAQAVVDRVSPKYKNLPPITVLNRVSELPARVKELRDQIRRDGATNDVEAAYFDGEIFLFADNVSDEARVEHVLFEHELTHYGLRGVLGSRVDATLNALYARNPELRKQAAAARARLGLDSNVAAVEEVLADMPTADLMKLKGFDRFLAVVRDWLAAHGFDKLSAMADQVLTGRIGEQAAADAMVGDVLRAAREFARSGKPGGTKMYMGGTRYAGDRGGAADIRYSRNPIAAMVDRAPAAVQDFLKTDRKLNRLMSKVDTPFHISEMHPTFKPVYESAQAFMRDTQSLALGAADHATDLLPRVETHRDVLPKALGGKGIKAPSRNDVAQISRALYAGTFYGGGNPMQGVVWTDEELRGKESVGKPIPDNFRKNPLTPAQIKLYREALAAAGQSLEDHSMSLIWRLARRAGMNLNKDTDLRGMAMDARDQIAEAIAEKRLQVESATDTEASTTSKDIEKVRNEIKELQKLRDSVNDIEKKTNSLIEHGYFPAMRFGEHYVDVYTQNEDGSVAKRLYFGKFESEADRNAAVRDLRTQYPDAVVDHGLMNTSAHKLMQGMNLDTMEMFMDHIQEAMGDSTELDPLMQEFLRMAATERSTLAREIHRKGVPGQSQDIPRVLSQFIMTNARNAASTYHTADMLAGVRAITDPRQGGSRSAGDLARYATDFVRDLQDPAEGASALRGLVANYYLMGSIAFGMVNLTQPAMVTMPTLTRYVNPAKAIAYVAKASRDVLRGAASLPKGERDAYERATSEGVVSPQEIHNLRAEAGASLTDGPMWRAVARAAKKVGVSLPDGLTARKVQFAWGSIFSLTEQFNRGTSFLAAYRLAVDEKMANPYEFASRMVEETQFTYNKANRPELMRGPVGAVIGQFKQFTISYVELAARLYRQDKQAFGVMMLMMFALAGLEGLPFAEDIEDVIDSIGQKIGYATNSKKSLRTLATSIVGKDIGDILLHGVSAVPGVPIDVASRVGAHNILPGTSLFKTSEPDKTREIMNALGPAAGIANRLFLRGDSEALLPTAIQNMVKGGDMALHDMYRDSRGKKIMDTDAGDAFWKAVGFMPAGVARANRVEYQEKQNADLQKVIESGIAEKWAQGVFERNPDKVLDARQKLADWNEANPELRVVINQTQIQRRVKEMAKTREERFVKQAAPEIRGNVRRDLADAK